MNEIISIIKTKGKKLGNYSYLCLASMGFSIITFKKLAKLLYENQIYIEFIEVFDGDTLNFIPPDLELKNKDIKEDYKLINKFLSNFNKNEKYYLSIKVRNDIFDGYLKEEKKYTEKDKENLKKRGWEFINNK